MIRNLSHRGREFSRRDLERAGEPLGECVTMPKVGGGYICGGGGKGSAPAAPDYTGAAVAQGNSSKEVTNMQTYANRPTQNTPWGSISWDTGTKTDPGTGQQVTTWTQNYNLTPSAQEALQAQVDTQNQRSQLADSFMGRVQNEYARPFDWGSMPSRGGNVQGSNFQSLNGNSPTLQTSVGTENSQRSGSAPELNSSLNYDKSMPTYDKAYVQDVQNQALEFMRPDQERAQKALDAKLANQGITAGSNAFNMAHRSLDDQQARDKYQALNTAMNQGSQMYQNQLAAQGQGYNQALGSANFGNTALQNQYGMNLQGQQANNAAINQDYNQRMNAAQFGNTALQNQQAADINRATFNNQVGQNQFAQGMQQSNYQNQLRQAAVAEEMQRRGMSLNEMNALLNGQQVQQWQAPQFNASQAAQPVQYLNAASQQYQANLDAANMANANQNSQMNGLFNLGSTAAMGAMMFSDSRLKKIIRKIGEKNGFNLYLFKYLGSNTTHEGVMAQEVQKVKPEAVKQHANGYLMVNYAALEA